MSGVLRLSNSVTGRSTIIASASNDQTFTLPALGGTLLAGGSSLEVIFPSGSEALPGLHVQGDTDTGLYAPAANTLGISTAAAERMRIDSSGKVGIGTTDPQQPLHVSGSQGTPVRVESSSTTSQIQFKNSEASNLYIGSDGVNNFVVKNKPGSGSTTEKFRITGDGNVGIGTSTPLAKLDVNSDSTDGIYAIIRGTKNELGNTSQRRLKFFNPEFRMAIQAQQGTSTVTNSDLLINPDGGNVGIGTSTPQATLDVNGDALINNLTVGRGGGSVTTNTAVGRDALQTNTTGSSNIAVGYQALNANTTGNNNIAVGYQALNDNTTGVNNVAVGYQALNFNTTGGSNTAVGRNALNANTEGVNNTAVGRQALNDNTTGSENTAIGRYALQVNTTGNYNTAVGRNALNTNTTGLANIGIGGRNSAGNYAPVFSATTESDRIVMGSTSVTNAYVQVAWTVTSDARDKTNFASVPYGLDFVNQLEPTAYQFKAGNRNLRDPETNELIPVTAADELPSGPVRYGFKAQDILALEGDNPVIIDNEDPDHLRYRGEALVPVLVNAIKEQQVLIDALTARLDAAGIA